MKLIFTRDFDVAISSTDTRTYPQGWTGDPGAEIAAKALKTKAAARVQADDDNAEADDAADGKTVRRGKR